MRAVESFAFAALATPCIGAPLHADDAAERAGALFTAREYRAALSACDAISDPILRAEWRFHVLYSGGDLEGALGAALAGLAQAPAHAALSQNALVAALKLRRTNTVVRVRDELVAHSAAVPTALAPDVERAIELGRTADRLTARARGFVGATALAAALLLALLTLKARR